MRRFYSPPESFSDGIVSLDSEQSNHLRNVLRLTSGDKIRVFDGNGGEFDCEVGAFENNQTILRILEETEPPSAESRLGLTLAVSLIKGDKFDLVVQKAVELGASGIIPLITQRTDVRVKNTANKLERWKKIIIESSKQCGRAKLMEVSLPTDFSAFVEDTDGTRILFAEKNGAGFSGVGKDNKMTAAIGPEGGWEDSELELARDHGFQIITLGGRTMRAETAAISIAAILQFEYGDLN